MYNAAACLTDAAFLTTCFWGLEGALWLEPWETQVPTWPLAQVGLGEFEGCGVDFAGEAWCWGGDPAEEPWLRVPPL